jgi:hypothetical protein
MAVTADYSLVPYEPGRQALSPGRGGYLRPLPILEARTAGLRERWSDPALSGRSARSPRLQPIYSSRRMVADVGPAPIGLMVDIFV